MTRSRGRNTETRTIQLWPGGRSLTYRGDADGPANQRSLRDAGQRGPIRCQNYCQDNLTPEANEAPRAYMGRDANGAAILIACGACDGRGYMPQPPAPHWRKGTADEWRRIRIELRAERYQEIEIYHCDSSLIDALIEQSGNERGPLADAFGPDAIENVYPNPDEWDAETCREWIADHCESELPTVPTVDCPRCEGTGRVPTDETGTDADCPGCKTDPGQIPDPDADEDEGRHGYLTELRDVIRDHADAAEVYEWWRVSPWLCARLRAVGEVVIDNNYGEWWGRCTTGQGLIMDGVLQRVAAAEEKDGQ